MRSLQVILHSNPTWYSDLQVCRSAAGWFVGTVYTEPGASFSEPGSRDTGYFTTEKDAELALAVLSKLHQVWLAPAPSLHRGILQQFQEKVQAAFLLLNLESERNCIGYRFTP